MNYKFNRKLILIKCFKIEKKSLKCNIMFAYNIKAAQIN